MSILPRSLRPNFPVVRGASLAILGSLRKTEDADFAVFAAALASLEEAPSKDVRFAKGNVANWTYTCHGQGIRDIKVPLEFLEMGGGFNPKIKVVKSVGQGFRAGIGELAKMKANTYEARAEDKDVEDLVFLLDKMAQTGEGFEGVRAGRGGS